MRDKLSCKGPFPLRPGGFRLDRPAEETVAPEPEGNPWIDLLRKAVQRPARSDRRGGSRHKAVEPEVWVGWWERGQFGASIARVVDISRGGAKLVLEVRPPRKQPVWVYKESGEGVSIVRAHLVGLGPSPGGGHTARLRFASPCPTLLCQAVVCEQGAGGPRRPEAALDPALLP